MQNLYFKLACILKKYVKALYLAFYIRNGVEDLNINGPLIKVSIPDARRLILHYIGILSFFMAAILKPSKMAGGTQDIEG